MKRRGFLKSLLGFALAPIAAKLPVAETIKAVSSEGQEQEFTIGDVIAFDGCYEINPRTGKPTRLLKYFVVTSTSPLEFFPPVIVDGFNRNVTQKPMGRPIALFTGLPGQDVRSA